MATQQALLLRTNPSSLLVNLSWASIMEEKERYACSRSTCEMETIAAASHRHSPSEREKESGVPGSQRFGSLSLYSRSAFLTASAGTRQKECKQRHQIKNRHHPVDSTASVSPPSLFHFSSSSLVMQPTPPSGRRYRCSGESRAMWQGQEAAPWVESCQQSGPVESWKCPGGHLDSGACSGRFRLPSFCKLHTARCTLHALRPCGPLQPTETRAQTQHCRQQ